MEPSDLLAAATFAVLLLSLLVPSLGSPHQTSIQSKVALFVAAGIAVAALPTALLLRYHFYRKFRAKSFKPAMTLVASEFGKEIPKLDRLLLVGSGCMAAAYFRWEAPALAAAAITIPASVWAHRYFRGYRDGGKRASLYEAGAVATYGWAIATLCTITALKLGQDFPLSDNATVGWAAAAVVTTILIVGRGHERKLFAAYTSQTAWLRLNKQRLEERYFRTSAEPESPVATGTSPGVSGVPGWLGTASLVLAACAVSRAARRR